MSETVLEARNIVKRYGHVTAVNGADFDLRAGEVLAVIGDNGAGKSSLIKVLSGDVIPDAGEVLLDGQAVHFRSPHDAQQAGIETVYQDLAMAPALDIATNLFLGREIKRKGPLGSVLRMIDTKEMRKQSRKQMDELGITTLQSITQPVDSLSGGQRQTVAVARAAAFGRKVVIMDEPTAALGVRESKGVLDLIKRITGRGIPVVLISHDIPAVFEVADRIHIHRLGRRATVVRPQDHTMNEVVGIMTGALPAPRVEGRGGLVTGPAWARVGRAPPLVARSTSAGEGRHDRRRGLRARRHGYLAVTEAARQARWRETDVVIVNAVDSAGYTRPTAADELDLDALATRVDTDGMPHDVGTWTSAAAASDAVLGVAEEVGAELLVVGIRRRSPSARRCSAATPSASF